MVFSFKTWKSKLNGWIIILLEPILSFVDVATIHTLPVAGTLNLLLIVNVVFVFWIISLTSVGNNETVYFAGSPVDLQIIAYTENVEVPSDAILKEPFIDSTCSDVLDLL